MIGASLEVARVGGSPRPLLGGRGVMSAKNTAVNLMILSTFLSFLLYRRANIRQVVPWAKTGTRIQAGMFVIAAAVVLFFGIRGYFVEAIVRIGYSVYQVGAGLACIIFVTIIALLMWATNLRIIGIVLGVLALYTLIANKIPQVQSEVPKALNLGSNVTPEQLVSAGDQLFHGAGGCTACHGLGTRAPNLLTDEKGLGPIGARCGKREPGKGCKAYLYESLVNPRAYVVPGYEPIMPEMGRTLSPQQL